MQVLPGHKRPRCSATRGAEPQRTCTVQTSPTTRNPDAQPREGPSPNARARCRFSPATRNPDAQPHEGLGLSAGARCRFSPATRNPDAQPREGPSPKARARCRFSPPPKAAGSLSHSPRAVRRPLGRRPPCAFRAVVSRAVYTRSLDARSPSDTHARGSVSPHPALGLGRGKAPPHRKGRRCAQSRTSGGVDPGHSRSPAPGVGHEATDGNHKHTPKKEKRVRREGDPAPCTCSGARLFVWLSRDTPWGGACFCLFRFLGVRGLPPVEPKVECGLTRFCAHMAGGLRASKDRVRTAGEATAWYARRLRGFCGSGGAHPAPIVVERTCLLWGRGESAPCTGSGARPFAWLSVWVSYGRGDPAPCTCAGAEPFVWWSTGPLGAGVRRDGPGEPGVKGRSAPPEAPHTDPAPKAFPPPPAGAPAVGTVAGLP